MDSPLRSWTAAAALLAAAVFAHADEGRLAWLDAHVGEGASPTAPFTAVEVDEAARTLKILGRELQLDACGLPARYVTHFSGSNTRILAAGRDVLSEPVRFALSPAGRPALPKSFRFTEKTPTCARWQAHVVLDGSDCTVDGELGFDGFAAFRVTVPGERVVRTARLEIGTRPDFASYQMGLGREGGNFPADFGWRFAATNHQDATWFGGVNGGLMVRFKGANYAQPLINAYYRWKPLRTPDSWGAFGIRLHRDADGAHLTATAEPRTSDGPLVYAFDLYLTPFKPIDVRKQVADRYCQIEQHAARVNLDELAAEGATLVNLHHNTVWNPYINYPYNEDGGPLLKRIVAQAHEKGLRVKVYYTTREITQNMPELPALAALGDEIVFRRPKDVPGWPVTNPQGPHPWLVEHLGDDILPAWRETVSFPASYPPRPDLAVITNPDSARWNNFYLAGLDRLVREYGVDGIYVDDTALNRRAMMRARRILDADGTPGRRIDMHSWNHHSPLAGVANSAVVFMDLYPFIDRLWYGESFRLEKPAEYWLVERSGIPFGLMGEQLAPVSPFRGMVFLMTGRWKWCRADPRGLWRFFAEAKLGEAEMVGWWDAACPAAFSDPAVRVTAYRTAGGTYLAAANFAERRAVGRFLYDCRDRGDGGAKPEASVPAIRGVQAGWRTFDLDAELSFEPGDGIVVRLEEKK